VRHGLRVTTCGVLGLLLAGCDAGERAARSEAAAVSRAIDGLRAADNAVKTGPLAALRAVPCTVSDVCSVQSFCVAAYEQHVQVLELVAEVKAGLPTAPSASVVQKLGQAESGLARAKTLTDQCATRQGEMARHYRVAR
jgi:hypothetical protein